jgi:hypothetical protein
VIKIRRNQVDKIGFQWNPREKVFLLADCNGEAPPVRMSPEDVMELGFELLAFASQEMMAKAH